MSPLKLTDDELTHVFEAARPLAVNRRDDFLQEVARLLRGCDIVGPGTVHRAILQAQRAHFDPPELERNVGQTRWDRDVPRFEKVSKRAV
jgi:hypothetical protein